MKNNQNSPYRDMSLNKIEAPKKTVKSSPKASRIETKGDLRTGGKK